MVKQVIGDFFETLGGMAKSTGQQVAIGVKKGGEDIARELGIKPKQSDEEAKQGGTTSLEVKSNEEIEAMKQKDKKKVLARYRQIQEEIKAIAQKKKTELPKSITGQAGFDKEKAIKQLEVKEEEKKKLPPLPAQRASRKAEMFRGVSG